MVNFKKFKTYYFLICYDISDNKRLRNIAKLLEQDAVRIQKSVFFYIQSIPNEMKFLVSKINDIITHEDDVRIYKIDINSSLQLNNAINLKKPFII